MFRHGSDVGPARSLDIRPNQALHAMSAALCCRAIRELVGRPSCVSLSFCVHMRRRQPVAG
jgi:hypothetical protein